jgi:PAS domain S-box-containing protein
LVKKVFATGQSASGETQINFPSKNGVWLETKLIPVPVKGGSVETLLGISRDITDRKLSQQALVERERFMSNIFSSILDGISILGPDLTIVKVNAVMEQWYPKVTPLEGKKCFEVYHQADKPCALCPSLITLRTGKAAHQIVPKRLEDGVICGWTDLHTFPLVDATTGEITGVIENIRDITDRKKIEQALAAEKERLDVTLSSIGDSVISTDVDTNIITINKIAETLTGYSKEEAIGRPLDSIFRILNQQTHAIYERVFSEMLEKHGIVPYKRHVVIIPVDGTEHHVDMSVAPIRSDEGRVIGMVLVFRDITERQKLETELFKARKLESLGVLAGGIAHDFNNILTGIITNLFTAKISMAPASESYKLLVDAEKACFRASRLTKQLLTFSKGGSPVKEVASIKELIEETVGFCLSGSNANYRLEIPDGLMASNIDKGQIDQVINNLLINALQAMPAGGTITVIAENFILREDGPAEHAHLGLLPGNYIKVSIKDEGVGIAPKDLEKIFDPYFTTKPQGTGLGLTTSYSIIKNHNGAITVESQFGEGSVFSFYLPALEVSLNSYAAESKNSKNRAGKILVMDDDEAVRTVVTQLLKGFGFQVQCAATGNETIEAYKNAFLEGAPFDVVIMDLTIPGGIGGKEALKILKETDPQIKAIVASGYSNDPVMANFKDFGFRGVIVKPFNIDEFLRVIESVMNL